jgi:hypothetical protein
MVLPRSKPELGMDKIVALPFDMSTVRVGCARYWVVLEGYRLLIHSYCHRPGGGGEAGFKVEMGTGSPGGSPPSPPLSPQIHIPVIPTKLREGNIVPIPEIIGYPIPTDTSWQLLVLVGQLLQLANRLVDADGRITVSPASPAPTPTRNHRRTRRVARRRHCWVVCHRRNHLLSRPLIALRSW